MEFAAEKQKEKRKKEEEDMSERLDRLVKK